MTSQHVDNGPAEVLAVDDDRLRLPRSLDPDGTYDVLLNGQHVWSVQIARDTRTERGVPVVAWPAALRKHLDGRAEVALRDRGTGETIAATSHVFRGNDAREVSVTDAQGQPLIMDKWNRLSRPLAAAPTSTLHELLDHVERILQVLRDDAGVPAFICYGTLLGAVRDGQLIGHDNDIDLAWLSEHPYPVDVVREGHRVERVLRNAGFVVRRGSGVRLNVRLALSDGTRRFVDVFTAHWVGERLYIPSDTGFKIPRDVILPLRTVSLVGRELPAPAKPEQLLAATYGKGWRVPDPSFKYPAHERLHRRLNGWFGGLVTHRKHWDKFAGDMRGKVPHRPSSFAHWVTAHYPSERPLVDVGCGNGRDALWFARKQHRRVIGLDYVVPLVNRGNKLSREHRLSARFELANLYDVRTVLALGARLARRPQPPDIYVRFTLHALEKSGRENVIRLASMALRRGGYLFLEFRTPKDQRRPKHFRGHARHYLDPDEVATAIEAAGGRVVRRIEGTSLARFHDEDPHVCRMVAAWS